MPASFVNGPRPVMAYEAITVSGSSIGPTPATIRTTTATSPLQGTADLIAEWAVEAFVTVESNPIRYRLDGTAPTSSEGHLLNANDTLVVQGYTNIKNLKMIRQGGSDATVRVTYFK